MKALILVFIAALVLNMNSIAQTGSDSLPDIKNEIGINLAPCVTVLAAGADDPSPLLHVFYKRQLKGDWYARAAVSLNGYRSGAFSSNTIMKVDLLKNAKVGISYTQEKHPSYFQFNAGIEKRWSGKFARQFAGLELGYAKYTLQDKIQYGIRDRDSIKNNYPDFKSLYSDSTVYFAIHSVQEALLSPFYGLQFNISRHLFFSAQVGLNVKAVFKNSAEVINHTGYFTGLILPKGVFMFDIQGAGVASNFSLCYHF